MYRDQNDFLDAVPRKVTGEEVRQMNGITLAFIGDAVYELMARSYVLTACNGRAQSLHEKAVALSNAAFQARAAARLSELLSEEEAAVFKRGRNAHTSHTPKNKTGADYHMATALEALFGYLYITGKRERLRELFDIISAEEKENA